MNITTIRRIGWLLGVVAIWACLWDIGRTKEPTTVLAKPSIEDYATYGLLNDRITQDLLWGPLQYDVGNKWVRVGPDNGSFTWNYVELEKGKLAIDARADESITECARKGVQVILVKDYPTYLRVMGRW